MLLLFVAVEGVEEVLVVELFALFLDIVALQVGLDQFVDGFLDSWGGGGEASDEDGDFVVAEFSLLLGDGGEVVQSGWDFLAVALVEVNWNVAWAWDEGRLELVVDLRQVI